jgi:circadian clock protein KaiB
MWRWPVLAGMASRVPGKTRRPKAVTYELCLYVAGETARSATALANLRQICEEHLDSDYRITIIDLLKTPKLARDHQILALPTLVRQIPTPLRKMIGDLSDTERVLVGLDIKPRPRSASSVGGT